MRVLLEPLLEIADSVMTYRRRYFAEPRMDGVLDLLLLDARIHARWLSSLRAGTPRRQPAGGAAIRRVWPNPGAA